MKLYFLINILIIYGVHATTRRDMIFDVQWLFNIVSKKVGYKNTDKIFKPLFDCTPCMSSIYGTFFFFMNNLFPELGVLGLLAWVFCLSGSNYIINKAINK